MLLKLTSILLYALTGFFLALALYPSYILLLKKFKAGKQIRNESVTGDKATIFSKLHGHKSGTPSMGGGIFLIVTLLLVLLPLGIQQAWLTNNSLITRQETYIILFAFFSMWSLGLVDDWLNILGKTWIKGMTAKMKLIWMCLFAAFISYRFFVRLGVDSVNLWPIAGEVHLGRVMPILTFLLTLTIVNAINITDGLDGLAGGLLLIILSVIGIITFISWWYIATTLIGVVIGCLLAFLRFNIHPAKIFMGDSWALALWWLLSSLVYLLNIRFGILVPFLVLMIIFRGEVWSSFFQILRKKLFKKKLFIVAPAHHLLEYKGYPESTIVMKLRVIQGLLAAIALIGILYQLQV